MLALLPFLISCLIWLVLVASLSLIMVRIFFFQAEDGIRDTSVTGVQTCALPISRCGWRAGSGPCRDWRISARDPRPCPARISQAESLGPGRHCAEAQCPPGQCGAGPTPWSGDT